MSALMNRRIFGGSLLTGTGALALRRLCSTGSLRDRRRSRSRVAILHEDSYCGPLERTLTEGLRLFDLSLRGKTVLLKPQSGGIHSGHGGILEQQPLVDLRSCDDASVPSCLLRTKPKTPQAAQPIIPPGTVSSKVTSTLGRSYQGG